MPHAVHDGAGRGWKRTRSIDGTDAVTRVEAQRLPGEEPDLPVVPYAGICRRRADHGHFASAATGHASACVRWRQLLHAAGAEPVSRRPGDGRVTAGNAYGCGRDSELPAVASGAGHDSES